MTYTVLWSKSAEKSLDKIVEFYGLVANKKVAHRIAQKILLSSISLENYPKRCQTEPSLSHLSTEYRYLLVGHHKIIFSIIEDADIVQIQTVFDCRQNPAKLEAGI